MSDVLLKLLGWVVRVGLLLAGLVFFASLLAAGLLVLLVWLLRALWAKLTGQPVSPWTFQVNRQAVWQRFNQGGFGQSGRAAPTPGSVVDVAATDVTEVTDVEPKRITPR
ncbi:hypothetical protein LHU53_16590 [Rhodoferax sp. U2-2l]|nr:hypothetical protein [Rhodoferax sp. U2-2l]MCB8748520.1 hypothetical protein [Rhodoferax sp. U2-2l]